jgi:hypothetical protein
MSAIRHVQSRTNGQRVYVQSKGKRFWRTTIGIRNFEIGERLICLFDNDERKATCHTVWRSWAGVFTIDDASTTELEN